MNVCTNTQKCACLLQKYVHSECSNIDTHIHTPVCTYIHRFPVSQLIDVQSLLDATVDGLVNGNLLNLELTVVDGVKVSYEKYPPIGNVVVLESK